MRVVIIDYESYYDDTFTLSKMSTESYIRDSRFEAHGAAIKWGPDTAARWYDERQLRYILKQEDWSDTFLIAWHAQFDGLILTHHYDVHPKMWSCPMSMARMIHGSSQSVSLENIRKLYGMPGKTTPYNLFRGKHWNEMTRDVQDQVARGAEDEVESIWQLFQRFAKNFPLEEYEVIDTVIRMFVDPMLTADMDMLAKLWTDERDAKIRRRTALGLVDDKELSSAAKFTTLLEAEGVEVEYKPGKKGPIPCFAKNDEFMQDLMEHPNERIRTLAEARIGAKSTLLQTRAETLGWMGKRGPLCVYLRHCGAGTLRPSGGDGANWLNFKRGSTIRRSIMAPPGYLLAPVDSSQIEFRVGAYLAGQEDVLDQLRRGEDPYVDIASEFYQEKIYKPAKNDPRRLEMEQKRGAGKQAKLMCQYGAAGAQFRKTAKAGLYGPPIDMTIEDANRFVKLYRDMSPAMCAKNTGYWAQAERMLARLGGGPPIEWGPLTVKDHKIFLPNGTYMVYDSLEYHRPDSDEEARDFERDGYWRVKAKHGWKKMWGAKLTQNICEAVSRVIVTQAMIRIKRIGFRTLNHPYDELLLLIPDDSKAEENLQLCMSEMKRTPDWLPGLPLDCEGALNVRYSK
jgi:DNA polymerase bacteriophage-type